MSQQKNNLPHPNAEQNLQQKINIVGIIWN